METELHKLRIDKTHRSSREQRPVWPIALGIALLLFVLTGFLLVRGRSPALVVKTIRVRMTEAANNSTSDLVTLNATGYVTAAHKIELASKVLGTVAWVGADMGDKTQKDQVLVCFEDEEYKAPVAQQ